MTVSCKALCHLRGDKGEIGMRDLPPAAVFLGMCWALGGEMCAGHRTAVAEGLCVQVFPPVNTHGESKAAAACVVHICMRAGMCVYVSVQMH